MLSLRVQTCLVLVWCLSFEACPPGGALSIIRQALVGGRIDAATAIAKIAPDGSRRAGPDQLQDGLRTLGVSA